MTARLTHRRLVAGCLGVAFALAGCASGERASSPSCTRANAAFDEPATRLTFRALDAKPAQVEEVRRVLCERLAAFGDDHRVQRASGNALTVDVPRASVLTERAGDGAPIFGRGNLAIYDWEANVIGPDGAPAPGDPTVTGGQNAGQDGALTLYDAVRRAARRPAVAEADNARVGSRFYAVSSTTERVFAQANAARSGAATRAAALTAVPAGQRGEARVYEVKADTVLVRAEGLDGRETAWYVLRDDVALRREQITNPQQRRDESPGSIGKPIVTFDFTTGGQALWKELTRELADRGRRSATSLSGTDANQHLAIAVDDELLSVPYIDARLNPEGIDGRVGTQVSGAFTIASARQLAVLLASDPLPVPLVLEGSRAAP